MDLDDTLLRDDWTISPRVVKAIQKAQALGVKMTIATGRMSISARPYAEQLDLDVPVITYHGAMIQQALSGDILFRCVIPLSLIHISEPTRLGMISYAVFCLKKKKKKTNNT